MTRKPHVHFSEYLTDRQIENLMRDFISTRKGESGKYLYFQDKLYSLWGIYIEYDLWVKLLSYLADIGVVDRIDETSEFIVN